MRKGVRVSHEVGKHFATTATDDGFSYERDDEKIAAEAALDGIYVIRPTVPASEIAPEDAVRAHNGVSAGSLAVSVVRDRLKGRVRPMPFLYVLAHYVEWNILRSVAPLLFNDDDPVAAARATAAGAVLDIVPQSERHSPPDRALKSPGL